MCRPLPSAKTIGVSGCPCVRRYCARGTALSAICVPAMFQSQSMMKSEAFSFARCTATDISIVPDPQKPKFITLQLAIESVRGYLRTELDRQGERATA